LSNVVDTPNYDDEFDRDITSPFQNSGSPMHFAFSELHESFITLLQVGFSETQALKFLAFCSIYDGDF
jgi:hypothetical protein